MVKRNKLRRVQIIKYSPGQFFGEKEILEKTKRITRATCITTNVKLYRMKKSVTF